MAAKNKSQGRGSSIDHEPPGVKDIFGLHLQASQHREELLREARELQAAGMIRKARQRLKQAQAVQYRLTALEHGVRIGRSPK